MAAEEILEGLIVRIKGADYYVERNGSEVRCTLRGKLRLAGAPAEVLPVVGDRVRFRNEANRRAQPPRGVVEGVLRRHSILARTDPAQRGGYRVMGSNMDRAILVFSAREPAFNARMLDRMLVAAECGAITPVVCLNKIDLAADRREPERLLGRYRDLGYRTVLASAVTGAGIEELAAELANRISIFAGPSGAGKTSLISRVEPGLELAVGRVSAKTGKGRHTTTHFELHALGGGGYLGDTPGVREFGIWGVTRAALASFFRDFMPYRGRCRFSTCTHSHEPDCAVKDAVESGAVGRERYESYLRILESLPAR